MTYNLSRWFREQARCGACRMWRHSSGDDRCIKRTPGVRYACCGHGREPGYFSVGRGVVRFAAGLNPFLLQAAVGRYIRTGHVAPFLQEDDERASGNSIVPVGCRFPLPISRAARKASHDR